MRIGVQVTDGSQTTNQMKTTQGNGDNHQASQYLRNVADVNFDGSKGKNLGGAQVIKQKNALHKKEKNILQKAETGAVEYVNLQKDAHLH
jgi:hypothetical protein